MNEERLNELMTLWEQGVGISNEEMSEIFAAARRCNELEAELDQMVGVCTDLKAENTRLHEETPFPHGENVDLKREIDTLRANNAALREALTSAARMNADVQTALKWVRDEIFALCEATEAIPDNKPEMAGNPHVMGRCYEAKGIRRTMGEVIRERIEKIDIYQNDINENLTVTPADSLTEYRDGILEEVDKRILTCCSVCSDGVVNGQDCPSCTVLRLTVRAMRTTNDID